MFVIYQTAIAKKKTRLVAVKDGKTLRLIRQPNRDDMVGPFRPSELAKQLGISLTTLRRKRKAKLLRVSPDHTKCLFIHADDLRKYEKNSHEVATKAAISRQMSSQPA